MVDICRVVDHTLHEYQGINHFEICNNCMFFIEKYVGN